MTDSILLGEIAQLFVRRIGLRIQPESFNKFAGILRQRAKLLEFSSLNAYRTFLAGLQANTEWEHLTRLFSVGETYFFRDHGQFELLRLNILPELISHHQNDKTLRLWSAGCASGEEAYSLAILVDMLLPDANEWTILITGSDIDSAAIEKAQRGYFRQWSFRMLPGEILARYFQPAGDGWILHDHIRRMVKFYVINLVTDPFSNAAPHLNNMDLILCRNVFIYFDPAAVLAVAKKLAATLNDRGYMLTAHTELIGSPVIELESVLMAQGMVYQRSDRKKTHAFAPALPAVTIVEIPHIQARQHLGDSRIIAAPTTSFAADNIDKNLPDQAIVKGESLIAKARTQAHLGDFVQAENICHHALSIDPLAADVYFLLAQLAEAIDDFSLSMNYLHKTIYLNPGFVEAYLELAKLSERAGDFARAQALRNAALRIVRDLPHDKIFEHYETSAGELAQWLIKTEHQLDPTQLV